MKGELPSIAPANRKLYAAVNRSTEEGHGARPLIIRDHGPYSARNSSKGALIEEAGRVFTAIAEGQSIDDVRDQALRGALLAQRSRENRERIWSSIQQRYLVSSAPWLILELAQATRFGTQGREFISLLYLLYALRDRLTFNFITTVLWFKRGESRPVISRNDVIDLLRQAANIQPQIGRWSESTRIKLAGSILTALRDFGLLEGQQKKVLVRPLLPLATAEALLRLLIMEGHRGRQVVEADIWRLFLLSESDVALTLANLAQQGAIRFERAGSTVVLETPYEWEQRP